MKKLLLALALVFAVPATYAATETKQVCHPAKDKTGNPIKNKDGSVKQNCKTVKVHKKVDGTALPTTPPKK